MGAEPARPTCRSCCRAGFDGALELVEAMEELAAAAGTTIAGGDVVGGPALTVTVAVTGWADERGRAGRPRRRAPRATSSAVTGELGGSEAGRLLLERGEREPAELVRRHLRPRPRLARGPRAGCGRRERDDRPERRARHRRAPRGRAQRGRAAHRARRGCRCAARRGRRGRRGRAATTTSCSLRSRPSGAPAAEAAAAAHLARRRRRGRGLVLLGPGGPGRGAAGLRARVRPARGAGPRPPLACRPRTRRDEARARARPCPSQVLIIWKRTYSLPIRPAVNIGPHV